MAKANFEAWAPYPETDKDRHAKKKQELGKKWIRAGTLLATATALVIFCLAFVSWITFMFGWHVPVILVLIVSKVILIVAGVKSIED
ncbi:hypothetical protein [Roseibium sp. MMSF_3412]|uniref:hypothetical protein n=1 Tax=Roseibium sp. MMSF_3412 TaxID=3046712 RepID=UPI00273F3836|nr:hypothetical protein [Roseibium sp. MMSF_3412]